METKPIFITYTNSDLTEGRGMQVPIAVSETMETAIRLGYRKYVMGSDCPIKEDKMIKVDGCWYVPIDAVKIYKPTKEDLVAMDRNSVLKRMKEAGFSDNEIRLIVQEQ